MFIQRTVYYEFEGTDGMGNAFEVVALAVGEVVHGINFPCSTGTVMRCLDDAVHDRVAEVHVRRSHIYLRAEHAAAFFKLAGVHAGEQIEILLDRTVAVRAFLSGRCGSAFLARDFLAALVVHIRLAFLDKADSQIVELGEIVGSIVFAVTPVEAKPVNIFANRIYVFNILLHGVGIIEAKVASAAELLSHTEIHADCFCMAYMKVAVWLRWKTGA